MQTFQVGIVRTQSHELTFTHNDDAPSEFTFHVSSFSLKFPPFLTERFPSQWTDHVSAVVTFAAVVEAA